MRTTTLGDLTVSAIGLGCNNFGRVGFVTEDLAGTRAVLDAAIDHGITFLDTAALYGGTQSASETMMGEALKGRRDQVTLASKWGYPEGPEPTEWGPRGSRGFIRRACEASLRRLQTDHLDLFQLHRPDPQTPIAETTGALTELVAEGKIRHFGHSGFDAAQTREAAACGPWVSAQNEYSLLVREPEAELIPALEDLGVKLLPFFPLANGLLTGKYAGNASAPQGSRLDRIPERFAAVQPAQWQAIDAYAALCADLDLPMVQVTLAWLMAQPVMGPVIAGATSAAQIAQNAAAAEITLPTEVCDQIGAIFTL